MLCRRTKVAASRDWEEKKRGKLASDVLVSQDNASAYTSPLKLLRLRGMFEMNCLLSSSSISTWDTIKTNIYLYRAIQYLHNGI